MFKRMMIAVMAIALAAGAGDAMAKSKKAKARAAEREQAKSMKLDRQTRQALVDALDDERKAEALYAAVLEQIDDRPPFANIVRSERMHAGAIEGLMEKYGVEVPKNRWSSKKIDVPATWAEACKLAIKAEKENIEMYDGFLKFVKQEDIRQTMEQLRDCSQDRHLAAFERCAQGGMGRGPGAGRGNGPGGGRGNGGGRGGGGGGHGFRGGRN